MCIPYYPNIPIPPPMPRSAQAEIAKNQGPVSEALADVRRMNDELENLTNSKPESLRTNTTQSASEFIEQLREEIDNV